MLLDRGPHEFFNLNGGIDLNLSSTVHRSKLAVIGWIFCQPFSCATHAPIQDRANLPEHGIPIGWGGIKQTGLNVV